MVQASGVVVPVVLGIVVGGRGERLRGAAHTAPVHAMRAVLIKLCVARVRFPNDRRMRTGLDPPHPFMQTEDGLTSGKR